MTIEFTIIVFVLAAILYYLITLVDYYKIDKLKDRTKDIERVKRHIHIKIYDNNFHTHRICTLFYETIQ